MKIVIQRVTEASVRVAGEIVAAIGPGMVILVGVSADDGPQDAAWLARKTASMRIFGDGEGVMNLDVRQAGGDIIVVSQFTLHASTKKGNRPSYIHAAKEDIAVPLYEAFVRELEQEIGKRVGTGIFGADMEVSLVNDGPVTIIVDSKVRQ